MRSEKEDHERGRVVLARHGETEWSRDGRHTGLSDIPLTAKGLQQASRLGEALADHEFGLVLVSPLTRARSTAELAGIEDFETEPNLVEWDYGEYEGRSTAQISADRGEDWTIWRSGADKDPALGETVDAVGERADAVFERIAPVLDRGEDVLLVAHGHLLRILAVRWIGLPAVTAAFFALGTDALSRLGFKHGYRIIEMWNSRT